jgi:hypothetical protein|tara:strand:- start:6200 stop:6316 length:117 start_codon:yes stop_codon:yes gene_type:complete
MEKEKDNRIPDSNERIIPHSGDYFKVSEHLPITKAEEI